MNFFNKKEFNKIIKHIGTGVFLLFILFVVVINLYCKPTMWNSSYECMYKENLTESKPSKVRFTLPPLPSAPPPLPSAPPPLPSAPPPLPSSKTFTINFSDSSGDIDIDSITTTTEPVSGVDNDQGIKYNFKINDLAHQNKDIEVIYLGKNVNEWPAPKIVKGDISIKDENGNIQDGSISAFSNGRRLATKVIP